MTRAQKVYCSGPLFSPEERAMMLSIARALEGAGFSTFLPQRDGIESLVMGFVNSPFNVDIFRSRKSVDEAIFALDVYQILEGCDSLVLNMNGRVPDEGAVVETAIAWLAARPLVIYKDDVRTAFKGRDNSMVTGLTMGRVVDRVEDIPAELRKVSAELAAAAAPEGSPRYPAHVDRAVRRGEKIAHLIEKLRSVGAGRPNAIVEELAQALASR